MDFLQAIKTHFRFMGTPDVMPCGLKSRRRRQDGRTLIARVMNDMGYRVGAEIGCRYGASAKLWCDNNPELTLTCIDPYSVYRPRKSQEKQDEVYEAAKTNLASYPVTIVRERSVEAVTRFEDESLDFVHIDGDHGFDAVMMDLILYAPKVKQSGMILLHDYFNFYLGGVVHAVNAYTACHLINPWFVTRDEEPTAFWQRGVEKAGPGSG